MPDSVPAVDARQAIQARLRGARIEDIPPDLYIPPSALSVLVGDFEGPLDLLLYLVRRDNVDILELNLETLTEQYLGYIDLMKRLQINVAAEYLLMAATLTEYKSRMLSPVKKKEEDEEQEDPRAEMVRRLVEYERYQNAARAVDGLPRMEREFYQPRASLPAQSVPRPLPRVTVRQLFFAARSALRRAEREAIYEVSNTRLSVQERMNSIMATLQACSDFVSFGALCDTRHGRAGVVVTVVALTELLCAGLAEAIQTRMYAEIRVRARSPD